MNNNLLVWKNVCCSFPEDPGWVTISFILFQFPLVNMQLQGLPPGALQGRECKQYPLSRLLFQSWGRASLVAQKIKNLPALWETWVWSLGREGNDNPLQHSCLGQSHGQKGLAGYSPQGRKASDTSELPTVSRVGEHRTCPVVIPNRKTYLV